MLWSYFCQHSVEISAELNSVPQLLYARPLSHRSAVDYQFKDDLNDDDEFKDDLKWKCRSIRTYQVPPCSGDQ